MANKLLQETEEPGIDLNDENIKNLVKSIYYALLMQSVYSATLLYNLIRQFALAFNEKKEAMFLDSVWLDLEEKNFKRRVNVPTMEITLYRDLSFPSFRIGKGYNRQLGKKNSFQLGDLNLKLQEKKRKMLDVFFRVYLKHKVHVEFEFPVMQAGETILPKL